MVLRRALLFAPFAIVSNAQLNPFDMFGMMNFTNNPCAMYDPATMIEMLHHQMMNVTDGFMGGQPGAEHGFMNFSDNGFFPEMNNTDFLPPNFNFSDIMKPFEDLIAIFQACNRTFENNFTDLVDMFIRNGTGTATHFNPWSTLDWTQANEIMEGFGNTFRQEFENTAVDIADTLSEIQDTFRQVGIMTLRRNASAVFEHRDRNFTFMSKIFDPNNEQLDTGETRVKFPRMNHRNKTVSIIEWTENPYKKKTKRKLLSKVLTLSLADMLTGNETRVSGLQEEINITLRYSPANNPVPQCVYWNVDANDWRSDGCIVRRVWGNWVLCGCTHLTDFAVGTADSNESKSNLTMILGGALGGGLGFIALIVTIALVIYSRNQSRKVRNANLVKSNPVIIMYSQPVAGTQV